MKKRVLVLFLLLAVVLLFSCNQEGEPCKVIWSGVRFSSYGMRRSYGEMPSVEKAAGFASKMQSYYEGTAGTYLLIVGTMSGDDTCHLDFPVSKDYKYIEGSKSDRYEEYLDKFDQLGYSVWLQVEPGYADLVTLAKLVLDRYGHHPCVKGFGIDVEWHRPIEGSDAGTRLSDADARKVLSTIREYNKSYTLFVKHWMSSYLPSKMEGLIYVNDSQQFGSLDEVRADFSTWAAKYAPQPVMFQIGYNADKWLWSEYENPARDFGTFIAEGCKSGNDIGIIWVDFTLKDVL